MSGLSTRSEDGSDNRLLISVWIMFAIGLGIYFRVDRPINELLGGPFYLTKQQEFDNDVAEIKGTIQRCENIIADYEKNNK